ncbi:polyprenyl synthetase family protein [Streptomyces sp. NPDC058686]|uniref:polyprenyl synthetase family protein n=1 Tax=Streptomyces sp. NPDC058686 TaxID=3346599 RepID=UPI0036530295
MTSGTDTAVSAIEHVVRRDAALQEDDLRVLLTALTRTPPGADHDPLYDVALRRSLYAPVADALGFKPDLEPPALTEDRPGPPRRSSLVFWAYRNYRGFADRSGAEPAPASLATIRRLATAALVLLRAAIVIDDIQDGSVTRYGAPALHVSHGVPIALNTASWLITEALRHVDDPAVAASLTTTIGRGFVGQAADMSSRDADTRAELVNASPAARVRFWEAAAVLKTGTLFRMRMDAAATALAVAEDERHTIDEAMRRLGLASQLYDDLSDLVPEFGGANTHEDFGGLGNRVTLQLLGADGVPAGARLPDDELKGDALKDFVLGHPALHSTLLSLSAEAVELKRSAKEMVHSVCRSDRSAAYFDFALERRGHMIDRLHETVRQQESDRQQHGRSSR